MNVNMLRARMTLHGDDIGGLASELGMHRNTFKIKMKTDGFKQTEIKNIARRYGLTSEEIRMMFFEEGSVYGTSIRY